MLKIIQGFLLFFLFHFVYSGTFAQSTDQKLANYYFQEGDCEKAIPYFEKIYPVYPSDLNYQRYLSCLREMEDDKAILKLIKTQSEFHPFEIGYQIELAQEYGQQGNSKQKDKIYQELIQSLTANPSQIIQLQRAFSKSGQHQLALQTLEKGKSLLKGSYPLNIQFAEVYGDMNRTEEMIQSYIGILEDYPNMISQLKIAIARVIDFEDDSSERYQIFRTELIKKIQKHPNNNAYADLLIWSFVQQRNFNAALVQTKALDKRTSGRGKEVYALGNLALQNKDFEAARKSFQYILELEESPYYYAAEERLLNTRYQEITTLRNYDKEEINTTIQEYETALARLPKNGKVLPIIKELAYIQAYYGNDAKGAIEKLNEALRYPAYKKELEAEVKILLGDILVLDNQIWEASLLYMQVDKEFKYDPIGEEAKFKNARIFYYDGDFTFAQSQLDVLKQATSRLIANDAMNLSIFITDNLGLDSNYAAMNQFAKADLLLEQHQFEAAFAKYDSIVQVFPHHDLMDDILFKKASAYQFQGKWEKAIELLLQIVENYGEDVLADDALFLIAQIYENHLFDNENAGKYYFQLMRDYPGSLFATEARKAYREIN